MERHEQLTILNQAWLVAQEIIKAHDADAGTCVVVDCQRLQASVERIERALGFDMEGDTR